MAVTTKKLFPNAVGTNGQSATVFTPVGIQLNNQDDLDVYVTLSGGTRVLQLRQSTGSTAQSSHPQVNNTDGLYFPAVSAGTTLYNYTLSTDNNTITFNSALPQGAVVFCERRTRDADSSYTTFASGSTIRATDLNNSSTESNFTAQDGRNKALEIEGAIWNGDQISSVYVTSANIVDGTIQTVDIGADQITNALIADDQIDSEHIVADSLDTEHYAAGSVDNTALGSDSVTNAKIADDQIDSEHYAAQSIDTEHIALENITTSLLAPDAVTSAKLADNAVNSEHYVDASIDHVHLANDIIDGDNIQDDVINSEHYVAGSIDHEHLANDIIDGDNIQDSVINSEHYVDGSIDREHLAADIVDGTKIADDSVDSEHIAAGALDNEHYADGSITSDKLNGATVITAAEQGSVTGNDTSFLTSAAADARFFNVSTGDTIKDGDTFPDNDTTIATTAAINDRIIDLVDDVGGFVPIANETSFPTANPDVNDGAGTLVSIKSISSTRTPSSGTVTIANGAGSGNTVSITGCGSTVLSAGFGVIVETTTTLHTYAFHRLVPKATEVTTVASKATEIGRLGTAAAVEDMSILGTTDVVADMAILGTADVVSDLNTLGTADVVADMNTLAVTSVVNNMDTVAGISSDVTTVAGISSDVTAVAADASDIGIVAADGTDIGLVAGSITNVNHVGGDIANVNTVANNIGSVNNFANQYRIGSINPTTSLDTGDLFFNTTSSSLKVYTGSAWVDGVTATGDFAVKTGNTFTGSNIHNDNVKSIYGTSSDGLEIYHNGGNSIIDDTGTGDLYLQRNGSNKIRLAQTGVQIYGNIAVSGNVDGRDVAADGTKLDLMDLNASALTLSGTYPVIKMVDTTSGAQDYRINIIDGIFKIQDNTDTSNVLDRFSILTNGTTSITGNLVATGNEHKFTAGTSGDLTVVLQADSDNNDENDNPKLLFRQDGELDEGAIFLLNNTLNIANTVGSGGGLNLRTSTTDSGYLTAPIRMSITPSGQVDFSGNVDCNAGLDVTGVITGTSHIDLPDDATLKLGDNDEFTIVHRSSTSHSVIKEDGGGVLTLQTNGNTIDLSDTTNDVVMGQFTTGGACTFRHANDVRLATSSTGITVTGNIAVSGTVDGVDLQTLNTAVSANTSKVTNATHTGDVTGATSLTIANDAVTGAKIADDAVDNEHIANNAVRTLQIIDNAVNDSKIANSSVTTAKIADDAVDGTKLANTSVSAGSYGSATAIPAITVDAQGRITAASTNTVNTTTNLGTSTATGSVTVTSSTGNNATISEATSSAAGVMSTAHHDKLDGIASSANNYSHPNHSGEVTSSGDGAMTIADNVVDEANLKVSNSPVNGYMLTAQSGNTGGLTWAPASTSAGVLQTTYTELTCANTESSNTNFSSTPEAIIDGCLVKIQITNTNSKILVTYSGMPISTKRYGPATAIVDIGFASSSSASSTFDAGDFTGLGSSDGLASARKSGSGTGSDVYRGQSGPTCVQVLHDHNLSVGQYAYYTLMIRSTYNNNSHGYIVGGHSGNVHGCVLQEVM